jgi:glycosyltransferase involved in cell wall biosynthesis
MQSLVSIVVPAYNASKYIAATIQSVQKQTYSNWELIIINDGSKDNTEEIVKPFLSDKRISIYFQDNAGVCKARNNGLTKAKGEFIALLDADDEFWPENLEKKITALENNPDASWVYSNLSLIDENSALIRTITHGRGDNVLENILLWNGEVVPGPCSNLVFRKSLVDNGLAFDPEFSTAADQDFCLQLAGKYKNIFLPEALACYRFLENSMSRNVTVMEKDHIGVYKKAEKNNLFRSASFRRKCFSNLYLILAGSWWVNGKNKKRALLFMWKSVINRPLNIFKLFKKVF